MPVTSSLQDYLEVILNLIQEKKTARVTDIAERLNIAKPSVIQALTILKERGLIVQDRYGPVELTAEGKRYAKERGLIVQDRYGPVELTAEGKRYAQRIRHRHKVIYGFLTQVLGVSAAAAEKDACLMEHDLSEETFKCLLRYLERQDIDALLKKEVGWRYDIKS